MSLSNFTKMIKTALSLFWELNSIEFLRLSHWIVSGAIPIFTTRGSSGEEKTALFVCAGLWSIEQVLEEQSPPPSYNVHMLEFVLDL